jgi:hypothetical protein
MISFKHPNAYCYYTPNNHSRNHSHSVLIIMKLPDGVPIILYFVLQYCLWLIFSVL